jgi:hypothetical protein
MQEINRRRGFVVVLAEDGPAGGSSVSRTSNSTAIIKNNEWIAPRLARPQIVALLQSVPPRRLSWTTKGGRVRTVAKRTGH